MAVNVGDIEYVIKADTAQLLRADKKVTSVTNNMDTGFKTADNSASKLSTTISKLSAAISVALIVEWGKKFLELADNMTQLQARIARLSTDASTAKETFQSLTQISSKTGASLSDTTKLWETLTSSLKEAGASNAQVLNLTDTLQKIGRIGGNSTEEMSNALRQFGQSIASGTVRAEEFNSILEQMPELARQIAAGMGISMGELRQRMLNGKLTAQDALNAIQDRTTVVNEEFNKLPRSLSQATGSLETSFAKLVSSINDATGASSAAVTVIDGLAKYIELLGDSSTSTADKLWSLAGAISKLNPGYIGKLLADGLIGDEPPKQVDVLSEKIANLTGDLKGLYGQAEKTAHVEIPQTDNNKGGKGGGGKSTKKQADEATESLARQQAALDRLNTGYADGSLELAKYDAVVALGNKASGEQIAKAEQQAESIWKIQQATKAAAEEERKRTQAGQNFTGLQGQVSPVAAVDNTYAQQMAQLDEYVQLYPQRIAEAEAVRAGIEDQYHQKRMAAMWEEWQQQSEINSMLGAAVDSLQGGATNAITGLINGTQSLQESFANIGSTILNSVVSAIVDMGVQYVKSLIIGKAMSSAATDAQIAEAGALATAWAPAAMAASIATQGKASAIGLAAYSSSMAAGQALSIAGARRYGGTVSAGNAYRINEDGRSEIFQTAGGQQAFIPNQSGKVISADKAGGGGVQNVYFTINTTGGISDAEWAQIEAKAINISKKMALFQISDQANRPNGMIQPRRK
ncbi:tape measure protein [Salmonella enterica]|uniref:tape measure protein n=1 Tax=Salmonella enterica TaxID=28901 RepID=UPI001A01209E|nr:tape measure protein [Salmonella enterica]EEU8402382.1 tape measure protein [Salmonella enterica]EEU8758834.1 tape measure protein [Salmonella enterica]EGO0487127.1 tape measure protein [Salmonella enterica]EJE3234515.1 tape measure protein [Salmonella enterica]UKS22876.1 tape measure protein [Salmonella enterica subsp. enterica serovar Tennessee]